MANQSLEIYGHTITCIDLLRSKEEGIIIGNIVFDNMNKAQMECTILDNHCLRLGEDS